ncbi:MAG: hypothetical protein IJH40_08725 [Ruminococcus sp.]|uniref:alpha/beta hydrolase n=1 Tax=Ruminococcus sp. TaxID=41978 RepID=UPI0028735391|nr:alpha/beta hydrolase-fold protein [Ruminococcus sp.]MBQ3285706.1 hypothetical protein [Ruminococcus sp.]
MKKVISLMIASVIITALFTACGAQDTPKAYPNTHTLYYRDSAKSTKAVATFFNSNSGESADVEMEKLGEDSDSVTFSCEGDCSRYNMVYVTCDDQDEKINRFSKVAFNPCISGWYKTEDDLLPYTVGEEIEYVHDYEDLTLSGFDFDKKIHIWTPDDYDPTSKEKYATVYVLDGQSFIFLGENGQELKGCPVVDEQVKAMTAATGEKAIVVAIESAGARDYEMVPDIGESFDEKMHETMVGGSYDDNFSEDYMNGSEFAEFIAKTLVPYIQEHYNVYTDALHTSITGASLGGLQCFFDAMEYPEVFGTCGAMSASFWEYDDDTWRAYLGEKSFDAESPVLYFFAGSDGNSDTGTLVKEMVSRLKDTGYPEDKIVLHLSEEGLHDSTIWRNVYSEFLAAMVYRQVAPLQKEEAK